MRLKLNLLLLYGAELTSKLLGVFIFGHLVVRLKDPSAPSGQENARYGDLEFAIAIFFVLNLVLDAGLARFCAREAARTPERANLLAGQLIGLRALILLGALLLLLLVYALSGDSLVLYYGLVLAPTALLLNWAFQARDEMGPVAGGSVLRQLVLAAGVLLLVSGPEDVRWVPLSEAAGFLSVVLFQHALFYRRQGAIRLDFSLREALSILRQALPIAGSALVWALRFFTPLFALYVVAGPGQTATLAGGHRLIGAAYSFVWLYFFNLLPTLSRLAVQPDRASYRALLGASSYLIGWMVFAGATVGSALSPVLIDIVYHGALPGAAGPLQVMLWALASAFLSGHARTSLIALDQQGAEFRAGALSAGLSALLCLLMVAPGVEPGPELAAGIFLVAEVVNLLLAQRLCASLGERLALASIVWAPGGLALVVMGGQRWLGLSSLTEAGLSFAVFLVGGLLCARRVRGALGELQVRGRLG